MNHMDVLAHRGVWADASEAHPENSLEALYKAWEDGWDGVEFDVRMTSDAAVVLHHDAMYGVAYSSGSTGRASTEMPSVAGLKRTEMPELADLPEVLARFDRVNGEGGRRFVLNIEMKDLPGEPGWSPNEPLADLVAQQLLGRRGDYTRWDSRVGLASAESLFGHESGGGLQVLVSSFSLESLRHFKSACGNVPTAFLIEESVEAVSAVERAHDCGCVALNVSEGAVTAEVVVAAHDRGLAVIAWTVDDALRAMELKNMGVDGVISNRPWLMRLTRAPDSSR